MRNIGPQLLTLTIEQLYTLPMKSPVAEALIAAANENNLRPIDLAVMVGIGEAGAKRWFSGTVPSGDTVVVLMRKIPSFRSRLGFELTTEAA